jgi:hypothetical protein
MAIGPVTTYKIHINATTYTIRRLSLTLSLYIQTFVRRTSDARSYSFFTLLYRYSRMTGTASHAARSPPPCASSSVLPPQAAAVAASRARCGLIIWLGAVLHIYGRGGLTRLWARGSGTAQSSDAISQSPAKRGLGAVVCVHTVISRCQVSTPPP